MYSRRARQILSPYLWQELSGDGQVFEPRDTSALLEAQERVIIIVDACKPSPSIARAHVAETVLRLARRYQRIKKRLDVHALVEAAVRDLLGDSKV